MNRIRVSAPHFLEERAIINGVRVDFTPAPYRVLMALLLSPPWKGLTYAEIVERVYPNPDREPESAYNCVAQAIKELRLQGVPIHSFGYSFGWHIPEENRGGPIDPPTLPA